MTATWHTGDSLTVLRTLPTGSVDLILTSPPFLALRSYLPADHPDKAFEMGSEPTPGMFLDALLDVVVECRRVLAPHGSLCVELGDTYAGSGGAGGDYTDKGLRAGQQAFDGSKKHERHAGRNQWEADHPIQINKAEHTVPTKGTGWPLDKSLTLIPETFRFALAYGRNPHTGRTIEPWRVRNVVRWCRPNPPVGALGDKVRPATSDIAIACTSRTRYFDLDAVRVPNAQGTKTDVIAKPPKSGWNGSRQDGGAGPFPPDPAGAPPLDHWWHNDLFDQDAWHIPTHPYSGKFVTTRLVPCGPHDGGQRTTSPDCPVHGGQPDLAPKGSRDARGGNGATRTQRTDAGHVPEQLAGFAPTAPQAEHSIGLSSSGSPDLPCGLAATPHSTASHRTDPVPATSLPDTASARTTGRTVGTSTSPSSADPHPDTPSSSNGEAYPPADAPGTGGDTARTQDPSLACTCSWQVTITESTSHYATWPPALCIKPILAMCPWKVCLTCGQPAYPPERGNATCGHDNWRNGVVLDCFAGSGTTLAVATGHGRDAIGIDLDPRNFDLARERIGMFLELADPGMAIIPTGDYL